MSQEIKLGKDDDGVVGQHHLENKMQCHQRTLFFDVFAFWWNYKNENAIHMYDNMKRIKNYTCAC